MPSALEALETVQVERWQQHVPAAMPMESPARPQSAWARLMARIAALRSGGRKRPLQLYCWGEEPPKPLEAPMDRVAREFPQTFLLAHCS